MGSQLKALFFLHAVMCLGSYLKGTEQSCGSRALTFIQPQHKRAFTF